MPRTVTVTATFVVQASNEADYDAALLAVPQGFTIAEDRPNMRFTLTAAPQEQPVDAN